MTAPRRLLDSSKNPRSRELLRAGVTDGPTPAAMRATALALGVGTSLTITTSAAATAATASGLGAPSLGVVAAKWIAIGTLGGVVLAGGASAVTTPAEPAKTASAVPVFARSQPKLTTQPGAGTASAAALEPPPAVGPAPTAAALTPLRTLSASASAALSAGAAAPEQPDLAMDVAAIDAARAALADGDVARTLRLLDQYGATRKTGTLDREAQLLRIDALTRAGDHGAGRALAEQYLSRFPRDPHAGRLRALLGDRSQGDQTR